MFPFLIIGKKSKQYKKYACRPLLYPTFFLLALYDSYGLISGFCILYTTMQIYTREAEQPKKKQNISI